MLDVLLQVIIGAAAAAAVGAVIYNWDSIRDSVAAWLRDNDLDKSKLMDAWIYFDKVVSGIRVTLKVRTIKTGEKTIRDDTVTSDQLRKENPDVYRELQKRGAVRQSIMNQVT